MTSILGIDLGSHSVYVAVFDHDTDTTEVLCDDLGFRSIPAVVAYREAVEAMHAEVLVGQSALQQQLKNQANTFSDVFGLLLNPSLTDLHVPVLGKEVSVQELASHVFRNINSQVNNQYTSSGRKIKDCVICFPEFSLPANAISMIRERIASSAKLGGLRVKGYCCTSVAPLLTVGIDKPPQDDLFPSVVAAVDVGWSKTAISYYTVHKGIIFPVLSVSEPSVSVSAFNKALIDFCTKDFSRRTKVQLDTGNNRAMTRLSTACEQALKILCNAQEATIVIDSLFEGIDYSARITRSRFEDMCGAAFVFLKNVLQGSVKNASLQATDVTHVIMSGGGVALSFVQSCVKGQYPNAVVEKSRVEPVEMNCVGATIHGQNLCPQESPSPLMLQKSRICLSTDIVISNERYLTVEDFMVVFRKHTVLPCKRVITFASTSPSCSLFVHSMNRSAETRSSVFLGELRLATSSSDVVRDFSLMFEGSNFNSTAGIDVFKAVSSEVSTVEERIGHIQL